MPPFALSKPSITLWLRDISFGSVVRGMVRFLRSMGFDHPLIYLRISSVPSKIDWNLQRRVGAYIASLCDVRGGPQTILLRLTAGAGCPIKKPRTEKR